MSCCPLKRRCPLFGLSTNGGFTCRHMCYIPSPWRHQCRVSPGHIAGTLISSHTNTSCIHLVIQGSVVTNTMIRHQLYNTLESQTKFESQNVWQMKIRTDRVYIKLEVCPQKKTRLLKIYTAKIFSHKVITRRIKIILGLALFYLIHVHFDYYYYYYLLYIISHDIILMWCESVIHLSIYQSISSQLMQIWIHV